MQHRFHARTIAYTALMTALVTVTGLIGITLGTGYINFGDTAILIAGALFGPWTGCIAGGLGAFLTDLIVYPTTMWFTLAIKALEGMLAGLIVRYGVCRMKQVRLPLKIGTHIAANLLCTAEMVLGYYLTQRFLWGTAVSAWTQLPWDTLQASVSSVLSVVMLYGLRLWSLVPNPVTPHDSPDHPSQS